MLDRLLGWALFLGNVLVAVCLTIIIVSALSQYLLGLPILAPEVNKLTTRVFVAGILLVVPCTLVWRIRNVKTDVP